MPAGRPSLKTPQLVDELLSRLILCDSGLEGVCEADDMPSALTVLRWVREDEEFRKEYVRAREAAGEIQAFRAMKAAINADDAQKGRLEYDARKWAAGKLHGKWYGDSTTLKGDPDAPLQQRVTHDLSALPDEAVEAAHVLAKALHGKPAA